MNRGVRCLCVVIPCLFGAKFVFIGISGRTSRGLRRRKGQPMVFIFPNSNIRGFIARIACSLCHLGREGIRHKLRRLVWLLYTGMESEAHINCTSAKPKATLELRGLRSFVWNETAGIVAEMIACILNSSSHETKLQTLFSNTGPFDRGGDMEPQAR